jgi:NADP-dependent 3-hydroxy acid dehydrogenase YdfG
MTESKVILSLRPEDVARTVMFAISSPATVELHELMVLPTRPTQ